MCWKYIFDWYCGLHDDAIFTLLLDVVIAVIGIGKWDRLDLADFAAGRYGTGSQQRSAPAHVPYVQKKK